MTSMGTPPSIDGTGRRRAKRLAWARVIWVCILVFGSIRFPFSVTPSAHAQQSSASGADVELHLDFESSSDNRLPPNVSVGLTGKGKPVHWTILDDPSAPAGKKILAEVSGDSTDSRFPLAIIDGPIASNVDVSVKFKPVMGRVDRAAGIAVRLSDPDNYYVARANALENNVRFYRVVNGRRHQIAGADIPVPSGQWQELRVRIEGSRIDVFLNGAVQIRAEDTTFSGAGKVGLWTKADSVTYFDDLVVKVLP